MGQSKIVASMARQRDRLEVSHLTPFHFRRVNIHNNAVAGPYAYDLSGLHPMAGRVWDPLAYGRRKVRAGLVHELLSEKLPLVRKLFTSLLFCHRPRTLSAAPVHRSG